MQNSEGKYEMKTIIQEHITLISQTENVVAPIQIKYDAEFGDTVEIDLIYNGVLYQGKGTDNLWVDAFANLQSKLPKNIKIACCMTCRHGNMCPFGNKENQLFCTNNITVASKEDLIKLFNSTDLYKENAVTAINYCDNFVYQSNDYYTYNDYLYQLKKKNN